MAERDPKTPEPIEVKSVFLVDDEPLVLKALTRVVAQEGYQIHGFPGAEQALAELNATPPDCIISDYYMPRMDGLKFLETVRKRHPGIVRVLLTGGHVDVRLREALQEGTVQILIRKPWRIESIRELMEHVRRGHTGIFIKQWEGETTPLPIRSAKVQPLPQQPVNGLKPVVVVVDDDSTFLKLMEVWLDRLGFEVHTALSAEEGIEAMRKADPDVMVVDLIMPGVDGIQMLRAVRDLAPQLPVVAITGMQDRNLAIEAFRAGATCFLWKPLDLDATEATLRRCLDLGRLFQSDVGKPELEAVVDIEHAIVSGMDKARLLDLLLQEMIRYTRADAASILLVSEDRISMRIAASYGLDDQMLREQQVAVGERISGWVVEHNEPQVVIGSAVDDPRLAGTSREKVPEVGMCLPMRGRSRVVGALCVTRFEGRELFSRDAVDIGLLLGSEVARAIEQMSVAEERMDLEREVMRRDKLVTLGELASGVAHEINNPLGYVNSNLSSLEEYLADILQVLKPLSPSQGGPDVAKALAAAQKIDIDFILSDLPTCLKETMDGLKRVLKIVMDLKTFARDDQESKEMGDVNQILDGAVSIVWNQIKYKSELKREYSQLPAVPCFPSQLGQVFLNLLYNAAQAIQREGKIVLRSGLQGGSVFVEVEDNGHGMTPEVLERIFEPFFTTKPRGVGTGLGLKIAKKIVERHGGSMTVRSTKGVGTVFRVEIPVAEGGKADSGNA